MLSLGGGGGGGSSNRVLYPKSFLRSLDSSSSRHLSIYLLENFSSRRLSQRLCIWLTKNRSYNYTIFAIMFFSECRSKCQMVIKGSSLVKLWKLEMLLGREPMKDILLRLLTWLLDLYRSWLCIIAGLVFWGLRTSFLGVAIAKDFISVAQNNANPILLSNTDSDTMVTQMLKRWIYQITSSLFLQTQ